MSKTGKSPIYSSRRWKEQLKGKVYKPHFLDLIAAQCTKEIEEARKRITVTKDGKYKYEPSKEYIRWYAKSCRK